MDLIRRAKKSTRALAFVMALFMFLTFSRPSQALLTELVVGAELGVTALSLLGQALPQITLVAANVVALAKSGETLAETVRNLIETILGKPASGEATPSSTEAASTRGEKVTLASLMEPASPAKSSRTRGSELPGINREPVAPAKPLVDPEIRRAIEGVVNTYQKKLGVYGKLIQETKGSEVQETLGDNYSRAVSTNEEAVSKATTLLLDAASEGKAERVDAFSRLARKLEPGARPALIPVLNRVMLQGRTFAAMNGGSDELFAQLDSLHTELTH